MVLNNPGQAAKVREGVLAPPPPEVVRGRIEEVGLNSVPSVLVTTGVRGTSMLARVLFVCLGSSLAMPTSAQESEETRRQIERLKQQATEIQEESHRELAALQQRTDRQLQALQQQIAQIRRPDSESAASKSAPAMVKASASGASIAAAEKFQVAGDFRLRYEDNSSNATTPSWNRGVLRGRINTSYQLSNAIRIGGRLVTGDPDNPRTSDTTIGGFDSDLDISLDQAYVSYRNQFLFLTGGKFAKPFSSTELVWDGDVNPQGLGGHYDFTQGESWSARLSAVYFLINEDIFAGDSNMLGTQLSASFRPHDDWSVALHTAYFDYDLGTLGSGIGSLARGNNIAAGGTTLLSDFDLLDIMSSVAWSGLGDRWHLKLVGNYVRNLGAAVPEDSGYGVDIFAGNLNRPGGLRFRYGYSQAETDAVLGMFSNDNIVYPTNYRLHTFSVDYALRENTFVGLTNYRHRQLVSDPGSPSDDDWVSRTRLNLYFNF